MDRFGLIGRSLEHSFSPQIHAMISDYEYLLYEMEPKAVQSFIENNDLDGFNVTIPYKESVMRFCQSLSKRAESVGSVNTMLRLESGGFFGENTDYEGFESLLGAKAKDLKGKKALVLGSGGSSRTVRAVLADKGIDYVTVSRTGENNYKSLEKHRDAALIVNTTPVGMYPGNGASLLDLSIFHDCYLVLDLIYNPARTALLLQAENLGIPARNGLPMLVTQGIKAGELFLGRKLPEELGEKIADAISRETQNIVLIGMPGCGKTTVGRYLSDLTGRKLADTDELIYVKVGKSIPEIFKSKGESFFRHLESEALREVSKESGLIIATGGGVVTVEENRELIRQNSVCVYLEKKLSLLTAEDRPLSKAHGLEALFKAREPLYKAWSDRAYENLDSFKTAKQIKEDLGI